MNERISEIVTTERTRIGKLRPITDTLFENGRAILVKYVCTDFTGKTTTIEYARANYDSDTKEFICNNNEICNEDVIIGWLFINELDAILMDAPQSENTFVRAHNKESKIKAMAYEEHNRDEEKRDRKLHELLRAKLDYNEKNKQFTPKNPHSNTI